MTTWKERFGALSAEEEQLQKAIWDNGESSKVAALKGKKSEISEFMNDYVNAGCPSHDSEMNN